MKRTRTTPTSTHLRTPPILPLELWRVIARCEPEACFSLAQVSTALTYALRDEYPHWWQETKDIVRVTKDRWHIKHVKRQTLEICLAAVSHDGGALKYVKQQTPEICLAAV